MKRRFATLFAAAALAAPAWAQQPEPDQPQIVVEGRRDQDKQIRELLKALPPVPINGHFARFERAACPAVIGVSAQSKPALVARMRLVAKAAGAPVGKPDCAANVLVIVTPDKVRLLEQLERRFPDYLGDISHWGVNRLKKTPGRTLLWNVQESLTAEGRPPNDSSPDGVPVNRTFEHASRLTDMAHPALTGSVLVIETKALVGLTAVQIADYAVMRTLTGIDPARVPQDSPQSILKVLDAPMGGETPITVTRWDVAFLRSFYSANTSLYAPAQRGEITAAMLKDLQRNGDPATGKQD
ncbi:MAG TPA: hypothetical protein VKI45_11485 [Allosphingosinicella sp.]|nr:hypothetical protein [Allosphingosinicella sp.]